MVRGFCYTRDMRNPLKRRPGMTPRQVVALIDTVRQQAFEQGMARGEALTRDLETELNKNRGWNECVAALHDAQFNNSWREYHAILSGEVDRTTTTENRN